MRIEKYGFNLNITGVESKNYLLAAIADAFDQLDREGDMDWSRVKLETEVVDQATLGDWYPHVSEMRTLRIQVPGTPLLTDGGDPVRDEA